MINDWIVHNLSFASYAARMAYLPSRKIAIAVSATVREKAATSGNLSSDVLKDIAPYLAPESPV